MLAKQSTARRHDAQAAVVYHGSTQSPELEQLYAAYNTPIIAHCARLLRDGASAEDAAQDVFLRVRRHAGNLPDRAQIRPWLFRVATNLCLNELRSRKVRSRHTPALLDELTGNDEESLSARNDARRFLSCLQPRAREVAWLTYVEGMRQCEVASTLGVSRRTVVTHLSELRARLRKSSRRQS